MSSKNRWGERNNSSGNSADDQALQALIASAEKRQEEKRMAQNPRKRWGDRRDHNSHHNRRQDQDGHGPNRNIKSRQAQDDRNDYYRPQAKRQRNRFEKEEEKNDTKYGWGKNDETNGDNTGEEETTKEVEKPNFALSGALANDDKTGNVYNGILLKFSEPPEARTPNTKWRLYVFRKQNPNDKKSSDGELIETLHISKQSAYLFGRETKVADIAVHHPSLSKQHCVIQYRALPDKNDREQRVRCKPYLMDLGSTNGTFINGVRMDDARYYELRKGDVITLGSSTREYVLLTENTTAADL
ncbi:smad nuclear-interacting protein 1 [Chaetoceros tenuissimus]|uniref:Smad nuclear-interacting protein 1 n=1 Tax=Chaetoceros tenuissimus TaxID=426638 RepID=A0AAD3H3C6_9STRA|nr:smad nuclear-interacting protein 1 [Chaetoceros tenuissimus]